jgi:hypothetical protein
MGCGVGLSLPGSGQPCTQVRPLQGRYFRAWVACT